MSQNMIGAAALQLAANLQAFNSVPIVYTSGTYNVSLNATQGSSKLRVNEPSGAVRVVRTDIDFLIPAALLILNGVTVEPVRGDYITLDWPDGVTRKYRVQSPGGDEPHYRYMDQTRTLLRIHCKFVGVA